MSLLLSFLVAVFIYGCYVADTGRAMPVAWAEALGRRLERRAQRGAVPIYFHLVGYMLRWWLFGDKSTCRNTDRRRGATPGGGWFYQQLSRLVCVRLHNILRSDRDRALHDHPCASMSLVLRGGYWEVMPPPPMTHDWELSRYFAQMNILPKLEPTATTQWIMGNYNVRWRAPGDVVFRAATAAHRIIVPDGRDALSIFALFKQTNSWGFYPGIERGEMLKVPWRDYLGIATDAQEGDKIPRSLQVK